MTSGVYCAILLAAYAFGLSDGGAVTIVNDGNDLAMLKVDYKKSWDPRSYWDNAVKPGTNDSIPLPYDCFNVEVQINSPYPRLRKIFNLFSQKPVGCSVTLAANPQQRKITLAHSDSRSLTVLNNGTFYSSVTIAHAGNIKLFFANSKHILDEGMTITFTVPYDAGKVQANVSYYKADPKTINPNFDDSPEQELLTTINLLEHDCYTLSGTFEAPSQVKSNCEDLYTRDVTLL